MKRCKCVALFGAILLGASAFGESGFELTGYASLDVTSGYVLYGGLENDEPCYWTYAEVLGSYDDLGAIGFSLWQNTDMTTRRKAVMRRMNEWDYSVFYRNTFNLADDVSLNYEAGVIWYKYHGLKSEAAPYYHTSENIFIDLALESPFITPHIHGEYDFKIANDAFFYGGFRHKFELFDNLTLTPDIVIGGGGRNQMEILYPPFDGSIDGGFSYVEVSLKLEYWFNEHFGIHARIAWDSLLRSELRCAAREDSTYDDDFVWGNIGVDFAF